MRNTKDFFISYFNKDYTLTEKECLDISNKLLENDNFFKNGKELILQKFFDDLKFINEQLEPLRKLGIPANIDLCGGAARDFILNRHEQIKDLDIMVSIPTVLYVDNVEQPENTFSTNNNNEHYYYDLSSSLTKEKLISVGFTEKELEFVDWDNPANLKINQLVQLCFLRSELIDNTFFHKINSQGKITFDKYSYGQFKTITTDGESPRPR